ncbi:MAG: hypothetical protein D6689_22815 [Deltaproteobacteria bacterium]|nr:MAG: hypothetical protein D6689_22815 [Deltaproteobacteria bacterium]
MRIAAQVMIGYAVVLVLGVVWRFIPVDRAMPDAVALFAAYLGLTARQRLAPSVLGAVVLGYLADLLLGTPRGMWSADAGALCLAAHVVHRRLIVRGWLVTAAFTALAAVASAALLIALRAAVGVGPAPLADELAVLAASAALTGVCGPAAFRLCRAVDAAFARTQRERLAVREGVF